MTRTQALALFRRDREAIYATMRYDITLKTPFMPIISLMVISLIWGIILVQGKLHGDNGFNEITWANIAVPWIVFAGCWALILAIVARRKFIRKKWKHAILPLKNALNAYFSWGLPPIMEWLNNFWAGSYREKDLYLGLVGCSLAFQLAGRPSLIIINPLKRPTYGKTYLVKFTPHLHILVADWFQDPQRLPSYEKETLTRRLEDHGFKLYIVNAGFFVEASDHLLKELHKNPETLLGLLPIIRILEEHIPRLQPTAMGS